MRLMVTLKILVALENSDGSLRLPVVLLEILMPVPVIA